MHLTPGTRLGPYTIESLIGAGGMGEVYKAHDGRLNRTVAIKRLITDDVSRFQSEARAIAAINHPHICQIYDVGPDYLVLEYLQGEPLGGRVSRDEAVRLASQIADALHAAHERGILHRDLKPGNVMVVRQGGMPHAKLLDFGVARLTSEDPGATRTVAGEMMGTPAYMSPEQASAKPLDARSDVFSFGAVLYELLAGARAFTGDSTAQILSAVLRDDPGPLEAPAALQQIVKRCLAKDPDRRFQTMADVRHALQHLTAGSADATASTHDKPSIVVLPFENLSADADNEFFSDGLTDEIITDLSQIRTLRVISRNSSMQLKGARKDLKRLLTELGVRYVLSGSVRKSGSSVRITSQLVDPTKDETLWADKYSGTLEDIFDIQEQISRRIVDALKMQLSPKEDRQLAERRIDNVKAFECYHRSRHELYKFTEEGLDHALVLIDTALGIVGDNELLYAAKGTVHWQYVNAAIRANAGDIEQAEVCVRKVFALNPDSAAGHALLGMVRQAQARPLEAIANYKRALATDPGNVYALGELGRIYGQLGRARDSVSLMLQARSEDPLSTIQDHGYLWSALVAGNNDLVVLDAPRVLRSAPEFAMVRWDLAVALIQQDRLDEARVVLDSAPVEKVQTIASRVCVCLKAALEGRQDAARAVIGAHLSTCAWNVEYWSWLVAECYAVAGAQEEALDWLENAVTRGFVNYLYLSSSRTFRSLHGNPRFDQLSARVKATWEEIQRLPL
jgi:serine/threonine protein kinase/Flp pilus assembly protein TadD